MLGNLRRRMLLWSGFLLVLSGCGQPFERPPILRVDWHTQPDRLEPHWGIQLRDPDPLVPPEAHFSVSDVKVPGEPHRVVVNLTKRREVTLRKTRWALGGGSPREHERGRSRLLERLRAVVGPDERDAAQPPVLLHADRSARWGDIRLLLRLLRDEVEPPLQDLQWSISKPTRGFAVRHEARVDTAGRDELPGVVIPIRLTGRALPDDQVEVTLQIWDETWSFGEESASLEDPHLVAHANLIWERAGYAREVPLPSVDSDLSMHSEGLPAVLEFSGDADRIPWAYVVKVLDLLMGGGGREVYLPDLALRLDIPPPEPIEAHIDEDDPVLTWAQVLLMGLAIVLAFLVTLAPLRARPRRLRTSSSS